MNQSKTAYITSMGSYLPGPPISNDEMESVLGMIHGKPSRLRSRILKNNGILTRHYALDKNQNSTHQNSELAAQAIRNCLNRASVDASAIDHLAAATTQGDFGVPGFASMVQAEVKIPPCEILTTHGVCSSGVMALKSAANQVRLGEKKNALVCASELVSRMLKHTRYEQTGRDMDFEGEFLRWMLSDGAGAALLQSRPRVNGISLRIDWIELISYASDFDVCMYLGTSSPGDWSGVQSERESSHVGINHDQEVEKGASSARSRSAVAQMERPQPVYRSWQDYPSCAEAEKAGAMIIRQNLRILDNIVKVGVEGALKLINSGKLNLKEIDHVLCHYSSHHFRGQIFELLKLAGAMVPEERWFTNLYYKGNTGCASIFIMLEELFASGRLKPGEEIFCIVPESGRFNTGYIKLTVVEGGD